MTEWRALVAGVAALTVAGCSLLVATDGLSSSGAASGGVSGSEAGTDAAVAEAGIDAGPDADSGPPPPFCASRSPKPTFCADFDTGLLAPPTFGVTGSPTFDTAIFTSPSRSLAGLIEMGATQRSSSVSHGFGMTPTAVDVAFQARLDEYDPDHGVEMASFQMSRTGGGGCNVGVSVRDGKWVIDQYCNNSAGATLVNVTTPSDIEPAAGGWNSVAFTMSFVAPRVVSMTIDGKKALDSVPLDPALTTGNGTITVGLVYVQIAAGRARAHLDDLTVDLR